MSHLGILQEINIDKITHPANQLRLNGESVPIIVFSFFIMAFAIGLAGKKRTYEKWTTASIGIFILVTSLGFTILGSVPTKFQVLLFTLYQSGIVVGIFVFGSGISNKIILNGKKESHSHNIPLAARLRSWIYHLGNT